MTPDFMIWHCAGCGSAAEGKKKPCICPTNVGTRTGPHGERQTTWWDEPNPLMALVAEQAEDEGLWFIPVYATEAILQQALRRLHAAIEGKLPEECARAAIAKARP